MRFPLFYSGRWGTAFACMFWACLTVISTENAGAQTVPSSAKTDPASSYTRKSGVVFTTGAHGDLLTDMYLPATPGLKPAVVLLHGGAWKHGDRSQMEPVAAALAEHGYVGMAIDYDTTTQGDRFPVALKEAERAVAWLREHAGDFQVDPKRIAVAGSSAGGELAALLALERGPLTGMGVAAAIVFNGVLDLSYTGPDAEDMVAPYLGGSCAQKPVECAAASPVRQVRAGAPPFFVGHGTEDRIVPYAQAVAFVKELHTAGIPVQTFEAKGAGHTYWNMSAWRDANVQAVLDFLKVYLAKNKNTSAGPSTLDQQ